MTTATAERELTTIDIQKETLVAAPVEIVWQAILDEIGPEMRKQDAPMPLKLEAFPGGRWYRDTGKNTGHLWGHVQVIKPPPHDKPLLELCGPMFMSFPAVNFVQYRLVPEGKNTRILLTHQAFGHIPQEHREGVNNGWQQILERIRERGERKGGVR